MSTCNLSAKGSWSHINTRSKAVQCYRLYMTLSSSICGLWEDLRQATSTFNDYMKGLDGFGDKEAEMAKRAEKRQEEAQKWRRIRQKRKEGQGAAEQVFQDKVDETAKKNRGMKLPKESQDSFRGLSF